MANEDESVRQQDANHVAPLDGAGSSRDARISDTTSVYAAATTSTMQASLPLRQQMQQPKPEPKVHDITEKFTKASNALEVGQLVKDEYFTLFESIGAIEIMDPKMDSGFLQQGETLEDAYDTLTSLLPEEVVGIMDQLLCYEMAWHTGYPLSQTLLSSVYIDKLLWPEPKTLEQAQFYRGDILKQPEPLLEILRVYCLALVKCCDFVIAKITSRDYFEEEDFCTHTYNRVLFVQVPMDVFLRELDAAIERLEDIDLQIDQSLRYALTTRLEFRKAFLSALDLDTPLNHLYRHWNPILTSLTSINATHQLGKPVPGSFSTKIQRRLASTVPPRPIVELAFKDAFEKLKQLCTDCEEATRFVDIDGDPVEYQNFLWSYASRTPTPLPYSRSYLANLLFHPNTLDRPMNLPLLDIKDVVIGASSPVMDPSNWAYSPPRNPHFPKPLRLQIAVLIDDFVDRAGQSYLDLWIALGQNRCRLRRMLIHVISGWDQLQYDAGLVDDELARVVQEMRVQDQVLENPLSTWVYHKKLWMAEKVVLLGFEQDIYLPDEFAGMYYFLSSLSTRRKHVLQNVFQHFNNRIAQAKKAKNAQIAIELENESLYIDSLLQEATGISELSAALSRFYAVLLYLRLLPHPNRPFSTEELRYELRMKPFLLLQPPEVLPFPDFQAQLQPFGSYTSLSHPLAAELRASDSSLWKDIDVHLKAAKEAFSKLKRLGAKTAKAEAVDVAWGRGVQGALASCIALGVAVVGIKNAVNAASGEQGWEKTLGIKVEIPGIETGKRYSEGWIVGKIGRE